MSKATRGEVWEVNFHPGVGAEIQKVRPAIVMSIPEVGRLPLVIVVPVTEWHEAFASYSWFVHLASVTENGLSKESGADAFQVKSVSDARLVRRLGRIADMEADLIGEAIALCVGV
jgi:mRNA interferase MazF